MSPVGQLLYLISPLILAGISNMIWMQLPIANLLKKPMDQEKTLADGRRLLGDNKTWKGFVGMILVTAFWMSIFELLAKTSAWAASFSLIPYTAWHFPFNGWFYGAIWGLAYGLAELPNSFVKRRLGIGAGQKGAGVTGLLFILIDQADSVLGCLLVMPLFYIPSWQDALAILLLAPGAHLAINLLLYQIKLKKSV